MDEKRLREIEAQLADWDGAVDVYELTAEVRRLRAQRPLTEESYCEALNAQARVSRRAERTRCLKAVESESTPGCGCWAAIRALPDE